MQFSLVAGGPTHRALTKLGFVSATVSNAARGAAEAGVVLWGALGAISLAHKVAHGAWPPLLEAASVHARLLVAAPLLLLSESLMDGYSRRFAAQLESSGLVERPDLERALAPIARARDSIVAEAILAAIALGASASALARRSYGLTGPGAGDVDAPLIFHSLVALPFFQLLLLRWVYRWALFGWLVRRLSRPKLALVAAHPDRAGGAAFFAKPILALLPALSGASAVVAASFAEGMIRHEQTLAVHTLAIATLVVALTAFAFAPLAPLAGPLAAARVAGLHEIHDLATEHARAFNRRFLGGSSSPDAEISARADMASSSASRVRCARCPWTSAS